MKVGEQLVYLARLHGLSAAGAKDAMERWTTTLGVEARRDDEVQKLSLGNQQRVQLAAALTHDPELLVLDEPFSGLDPVAVDVMSGVLRDRADAGVPVVFSSHQLDLVERLCDRVGIIKDGAMVEVGTIDELRRTEQERWVVDGPPGATWIGAVPDARAVSLEGRAPSSSSRPAVRPVPGPVTVPGRPRWARAGRAARGARRRARARVRARPAVAHRALPRRRERRGEAGRDGRRDRGGGGMSAGQGTSLTSWGAIRLVAGREIMTRLRSKSFVWLTVILVGAVVLGGVVLNLANGSGPSAERVGVTPQTAALAETIETTGSTLGTDVETVDVADDAAGEAQVRDGDLDALVTGSAGSPTVVVDTELSSGLTAVFTTLAQQTALSDAVASLGATRPGRGRRRDGRAGRAHHRRAERVRPRALRHRPGHRHPALHGHHDQRPAHRPGVVEEKTSRVVELLLSTVRPWQLMAGKVLGIGLVGLGQVALVVLAGVGTALGLGLVDTSTIDLGTAAAWALVWFVVGFVSYALLMAGLGALVSRQEDVGAVTTPVTFLMIVPYIVGVSVAPWAPDNPLVVWLSYVPLCSPLLMPVRIALGSAEPWEALVALGLRRGHPLLVWLAAKIYSNAVLRTGARVRLKDALRTS